jgi:hypothetical protein
MLAPLPPTLAPRPREVECLARPPVAAVSEASHSAPCPVAGPPRSDPPAIIALSRRVQVRERSTGISTRQLATERQASQVADGRQLSCRNISIGADFKPLGMQ